MQQHTRRLAFLLAASMLAGVGVLAACDTDNTIQALPGSSSSTSTSSSSGSQGDDDDTTPGDDDDDGGATDGGSKADCGSAPRLRTTSAGFFCGFFRDGGADAGGLSNCSNDETCCNPGKDGTTFPPSWCANTVNKDGKGPTTCANTADAYGSKWVPTGSTTWECSSTTNCGGTKKCCAHSFPGADAGNYINYNKSTGSSAPPAACNAQTLFKIGGTKCADDCAEKSEIELCSNTDKTCSGGKTCTPASATGSRDLGFCK